MVLLHPKDTPKSNLYAILAVQPRIAGGTLSMAEIPAGMLDDTGSFAGGAAKELEEEVGLKISEDELIPLSLLAIQSADKEAHAGFALEGEEDMSKVDGYFSSVGALDEVLTFHAFVHELEEGELKDWRGKLTGLKDEGEKITLKVVKFDELWKATRDVKALCAWGLWTALKEEGKIDYFKE